MLTNQKPPLPGWPEGLYVWRPVGDPDPNVDWLRTGGTWQEPTGVIIVQCGCHPDNTWNRLGNRRAVECTRCGRILARVGKQIIAGGQRV